MSWIDRLGAPAYHMARTVLGAAAHVYFRRIEVRHGDRVPERGPLLVVANHPASFTDVIVLGTAISRRLHFLAMAPIFEPWIRGLGLRLCGTLPIYRREDDPTRMGQNDQTFRACHEILDAGGAVLIFPEGTSLSDRTIVKVKTGAARLALGQEARPGQHGRLTLLPVGLHFADRTQFQSEVVLTVGRPIELAPFREQALVDGPLAVRALTDRIQGVLEKLILHVPELDRAALVAAVERLYREEAHAQEGKGRDFEVVRGIAEVVAFFARSDPDRVARGWQRVHRYERRLEALHIEDRTLREMLPRQGRIRERIRLIVLGLLGVGPALVGGLLHYVPYRLSAEAGRLTGDPTRIAAARIAVALVLFPLTYAAIAAGLSLGLGWSPRRVAAALGVLVVLGLHALVYFQWLAHQRQRIRLVLLKASHLRHIAELRQERRELIRLFEQTRRDFEAARASGQASP